LPVDQFRQCVPDSCESVDDPDKPKILQVVRRRSAVQAAIGAELTIKIFEEL
jgi:hypothetical protein